MPPICQAIYAYLEEKKTTPPLEMYNNEPSGSYSESKKCGCRYCALACGANTGDEIRNKAANQNAVGKNSGLKYSEPRTDGSLASKNEDIRCKFNRSGVVFEKGGGLTEVFVVDRADDPIIPVASSISGYTGSDESFNFVIKWFKACISEHRTLCPSLTANGTAPELPHRLIDVIGPGAQNVKLVETKGQLGHYVCLSHSWGGEQPLITTLDPDTLSEFKEGIEMSMLPRTFREAVVVARKFGSQYLWIDSLCIIQDSTEDWLVQSALMAKIYRNAVVTISASASSTPHEGLFREAAKEHIDFSSGPDVLDKIRIREPLLHNAYQLPLMKRGWVFQERLLSPRYLHFGHNELIWECMEHVMCECGSMNRDELPRKDWLEPKNRLHPETLQHIVRLDRLPVAWRAAVEDYSHMALSHSGDIFPAISGIAKVVIEETNCNYVAGLWKETLIIDLLWKTERPEAAQRCQEWRAPTFSWASVMRSEGGKGSFISYSYPFMMNVSKGLDESEQKTRTDIYATVVEARCEPEDRDVTGQLKSGFIVLRSTLIRAIIRFQHTRSSDKWCIDPLGKDPLEQSFFWPDVNLGTQTQSFQDDNVVYCLKLIGVTRNVDFPSHEFLLYLVLRQVDQVGGSSAGRNEDRVFERIALLRDTRSPGEAHLEDASEESAIERNVLVKVV